MSTLLERKILIAEALIRQTEDEATEFEFRARAAKRTGNEKLLDNCTQSIEACEKAIDEYRKILEELKK